MSLVWPQLYQHRPGRKLHVHLTATEVQISEESRFLCHRYLSRKMRRSALSLGSANLAHVKSFQHRTDEHTTLIVCQMIETLEQLYPEIYNNISAHLHISSYTERLLCQDFVRFTEALFKNGIKWSLILSYFAFCGGLAEDCVRHSNARLINSILNWNHCFVSTHLSKWISNQGGWPGMVDYFHKTGKNGEVETKSGRISWVAEITATAMKQKTEIFRKTLLGKEEVNKQTRSILITSAVTFLLLYLIVIASRRLLEMIYL